MNATTALQLSSARPLGLGLAALAALVLTLALWAATAPIDGAIVLKATVGDSSRSVQVIPLGTGRVVELLVADGDHVDAGAPLMRLEQTASLAALRAADERRALDRLARARASATLQGAADLVWPADLGVLIGTSRALADRAMAERLVFAGAQDAARAEDASLRLSRHEAEVARTALVAQIAENNGQQADVRRQLGDQVALSGKGLALSGTAYLLRRDLADLAQAAARLSAGAATVDASLAATEADMARQRNDRRAALAAELAQIDQRLTQSEADRAQIAEAIASLTLRAPVAGTIADLQVIAAGGAAIIGRPVMTIIPDDDRTRLTSTIAPDRIADLREGMAVRVEFRATGTRPASTLRGKIARIMPAPGATQALRDASPRAIIALDAGERIPDGLPGGAPADVVIPSGEHTPLGFLFAPMTDAFTRPAATAPP